MSGHEGWNRVYGRFTRSAASLAMGVLVFGAVGAGIAQGPPGHDHHNPPPGHGGVPPGQAKKYNGNDWRFRQEDRSHFYNHYQRDADHWRGRKRPVFVRGRAIPRGYTIQPVPQAYWQGMAPPPPGYQYGYSDGYVVAYDPTTRIIADVLDLVTSAATR
ncbi:MAG TPA: hypothetical protein VGG95_06475 [Edaphobacter sp.]|jgi:hypothetical protein